jgi:hypothetical protein
MDASKRNRLEEAGWTVGDAQDFLGLSDEEAAVVEVELALSESLRERRTEHGMMQTLTSDPRERSPLPRE